jgi:hypothetical protein
MNWKKVLSSNFLFPRKGNKNIQKSIYLLGAMTLNRMTFSDTTKILRKTLLKMTLLKTLINTTLNINFYLLL